jgi:hypothetical protein
MWHKNTHKTIKHMLEAVARVYTVENRSQHSPFEMVKTSYWLVLPYAPCYG